MAPRLRVTIVIPVHNEADMIGPCLDAVLGQRVAADEVIVVDNNSTDATAERLSAYEGRIRVVHEARQGVQFARTAGFDAASGDVIGRILLVLFPPLRVLHFLHHRGGRRPAAARRRNPMSA